MEYKTEQGMRQANCCSLVDYIEIFNKQADKEFVFLTEKLMTVSETGENHQNVRPCNPMDISSVEHRKAGK